MSKKKEKRGLYIDSKGKLIYINYLGSKSCGEEYVLFNFKK